MGQRSSKGVKVLALHVEGADSVPSAAYIPVSTARSDPCT